MTADRHKPSITTVWDCEFTPSIPTATCLVTSTSPGSSFPGVSTSFYPSQSPDAFPTYLVDITAGSVTGGVAASESASPVMTTATASAVIPAITSDLLSPPFRGSNVGSADATSTADSSRSSATVTGATTSMTGVPSSSVVVTSPELSTTNSEASSTSASVGPQKTGAASSKSLTATLNGLIFILFVIFAL